jgi:hypothetical protein
MGHNMTLCHEVRAGISPREHSPRHCARAQCGGISPSPISWYTRCIHTLCMPIISPLTWYSPANCWAHMYRCELSFRFFIQVSVSRYFPFSVLPPYPRFYLHLSDIPPFCKDDRMYFSRKFLQYCSHSFHKWQLRGGHVEGLFRKERFHLFSPQVLGFWVYGSDD